MEGCEKNERLASKCIKYWNDGSSSNYTLDFVGCEQDE